jgi:uncharacterized membrane protein
MSVAASQRAWKPEPGVFTEASLDDCRTDAATERVSLEWVLRRNCSLSPKQLIVACFGIGGVALAIAVGFWWSGATLVVPFACIELLALGAALLVHARHALDSERLLLRDGLLVVQRVYGGRSERMEFEAAWVRVTARGKGSLVELTGGGRRAVVGRFVAPALRLRLARELRNALRGTAE